MLQEKVKGAFFLPVNVSFQLHLGSALWEGGKGIACHVEISRIRWACPKLVGTRKQEGKEVSALTEKPVAPPGKHGLAERWCLGNSMVHEIGAILRREWVWPWTTRSTFPQTLQMYEALLRRYAEAARSMVTMLSNLDVLELNVGWIWGALEWADEAESAALASLVRDRKVSRKKRSGNPTPQTQFLPVSAWDWGMYHHPSVKKKKVWTGFFPVYMLCPFCVWESHML